MKFILAGSGNTPADWPLIQKAVPEADRLGFWGFGVPDHYMGGPNFGGDSTLDSWILLAYLAAQTDRIKLGTLVTPIPLRQPGILAKMVSTLDVISDGRAMLGVGAGSSDAEFEAYSQTSPPGVRVERTMEAVDLITRLWTEAKVHFQGKYYRAVGAVLEPKPRQKPHPPLLFGGMGPQMMRLAGKHASICLIPIEPEGQALAKRIVLEEARRLGRHDKISFAGAAEALPQPRHPYSSKNYLEKLKMANEAGCEYFVVPSPRETYLESIRDFATGIMPSFL